MKATLLGAVLALAAAPTANASGKATPPVYRVDHVVDSDTIALRNGQRVRLVQIDARGGEGAVKLATVDLAPGCLSHRGAIYAFGANSFLFSGGKPGSTGVRKFGCALEPNSLGAYRRAS